jgi:hypothetical protein
MALIGHEQQKEGKAQFVATFDNGTLEQLEELKTFFKQPDKTELVKLGISLLQRAKEAQENSRKP